MTKMLGAMLEGSLVSLEIFFLTLLFALPLALPVALGRMSASRLVRAPIVASTLVATRALAKVLRLMAPLLPRGTSGRPGRERGDSSRRGEAASPGVAGMLPWARETSTSTRLENG